MATVEKNIVVNAMPDKIWRLATDPNKWHTWFEGVRQPKSIQGDGVGGVVFSSFLAHRRLTRWNVYEDAAIRPEHLDSGFGSVDGEFFLDNRCAGRCGRLFGPRDACNGGA